MMMMTMPPKHWKTVKLGDVCNTSSGGTPLKSNKSFYENGTVPWLLSGEVCQKEIVNCKKYITYAGLKNSSAKLFPPNTLLIAMYGATAGQVGILRFESSTNQAVCGILPSTNCSPDFLYYVFSYKKSELVATATGNAQPNISQIKIKETLIHLPPLEEQQQIVAILDEAFTALEQAKANVARNKANARAVFESVLNTIFNPTTQDDQQGWKTVKLGDIALKIGSGSTPRGGQESYKTEGIPLIRSLNVHDRTFKYKNLAFLDELQAKSLANVTVQEGDVLLNITGASVARCCLVVQDVVPARVNQHVSIIRVSQDKIQPEFLEYLLTSTFYKNALLGVGESGGTTRQAITKTELESFRIKFPNSLQQQRDIVDSVKQVERFTQALEAMYNKKLTAIDELKQALLHHAFTGQLTTPARHVECNETSLYHVQDDKLLQEALHP